MAALSKEYQLLGNAYIGNLGGEDCYLRLYGKYTEQDIANNRSYIAYRSAFYIAQSYGYVYTGATTTKYISGSGLGGSSNDATGNYYPGETTLYEQGGWVTHNDAGELSVWASTRWYSSPWGKDTSTSFSASLPTIPRASYPTVSNSQPYIEDTITIYTNRKASFTHKLTYKASGQSSETTIATDVTDSTNFTIPSSLYALIPNSKTIGITIYCYTYNGSNQVGSTQTTEITAVASESKCSPYTDTPIYTVDSLTKSLTSNSGIYETFINGVTDATIEFMCASKNSATLSTAFLWRYDGTNKVIVSTKTLSGTSATASISLSNITYSKLYPGVIDSRGYSYYSPFGIPANFDEYVKPTIDGELRRTNQTSSEVKILTLGGNFWDKEFIQGGGTNTLTLSWRYKKISDPDTSYTSWVTLSPTLTYDTTNNKYSLSSAISLGSLFDYKSSWNIQIRAVDKVCGSALGDAAIVRTFTITRGIENFSIFQHAIKMNGEVIFYDN